MSRLKFYFLSVLVVFASAFIYTFHAGSKVQLRISSNPHLVVSNENAGNSRLVSTSESIGKISQQAPEVKTLDVRIAENQRQVEAQDRGLSEARVVERLNTHRLSAVESQGLYAMIDKVAQLRAEGIEMRLHRLQARIGGVEK